MKTLINILLGFEKHGFALDPKKHYIIVANHNSHIDTMAIMQSLPFKILTQTHPIAAKDYFGRNRVYELFFKYFANLSFIDRGKNKSSTESPLQDLFDLLDQSKNIIFYPEGSRGEPGEISQFRRGILEIIKDYSDVPIIPIYVNKSGWALPKGNELLVPIQVKANFGEPIFLDPKESDQRNLDYLKESIMILKKF